MRPSNKSRSRNKSGNNSNRRNVGNVVNRVFESAGPDGKVRGTPQQIIDKYQALARDAQVSGDRVAAENYLQHAEHYARLLGDAQRQMNEGRERDDRDDRDEPYQREGGYEDRQRDGGQQDRHRDGDQRDGDQRHRRPAGGEERAPSRDREPAEVAAPVASEPAGLTTLGAEDDHEGPVETPEEAARRHAEGPAPIPPVALVNGEHAEPAVTEAPPTRPRTRRRAKAAQPAEAGAE
jgi:hypothetical protein